MNVHFSLGKTDNNIHYPKDYFDWPPESNTSD